MNELLSLLCDVAYRAGAVAYWTDSRAQAPTLREGPALRNARAEARRTLRALDRLRTAIETARAEVAP